MGREPGWGRNHATRERNALLGTSFCSAVLNVLVTDLSVRSANLYNNTCNVLGLSDCHTVLVIPLCFAVHVISIGNAVLDISVCNAVLDIALLVDNSGSIKNGSMTSENYAILKAFVKSLIDTLDVGRARTRVGLVRFSTDVHTEFRLNTYMDNKAAMKRHVDSMPFDGKDTHISGALQRTRTDIFSPLHGDRPWIQNVAIVIADGQSNILKHRTRPEATLLKDSGRTRVYVVAVVTKEHDQEELEFIASDPDSAHYFDAPTITTLPLLKCKLLKGVCTEEVFKQCV